MSNSGENIGNNQFKDLSYKGLSWVAAVALFMQTLDATILNTALPSIAKSLNESPLALQWAIIAYAMTVALFIPVSGWLADKFGTLKIFQLAIIIFCAGSIFCALSNSLEQLILSRVIQGIGGSLLMPTARLALIRTIPQKELLSVWNMAAMAGLIGPVLGPIVGGVMVTYASWHWIFLINIPIAFAGIIFSTKFMPNAKGVNRPLDKIGFAIFAACLFCFTLGLDLLNEIGAGKVYAALFIIASILLFFIYLTHYKKSNNVLINLSLFKSRIFALGLACSFFLRISAASVPYLIPLLLQIIFNYSAQLAGFLLAPIALGSIIMKPFTPRLINKFGYKLILLISAFAVMCSTFSLGFIGKDSPLWILVFILIIYGAFISLIYTGLNTLTLSDINQENASDGSTLLSIMQQMGLGVGIAFASVLLDIFRQNIGEDSLLSAFQYTIFSSAFIAVIGIVLLSRFDKSDGDNMRK